VTSTLLRAPTTTARPPALRSARRLLGRGRRWVRRRLSPVPDLGDAEVRLLERRYRGHPAAAHTHWSPERQRRGLNLPDYRSDNLYVWQRRIPADAWRLSWEYVVEHCRPDLVAWLHEDGSHGATTVDLDGRVVSRDLVDSILELDFLAEHIPGFAGAARLRVLDIGAGYGRLADRATTAFPALDWRCVDAVPISTALCRHHLRQVGSPASVVDLDRAHLEVPRGSVDLAVNVHSFNECSLATIGWWARFLAEREVPYLFVVPNDTQWLQSSEPDGTKADYEPVLADAGYRVTVVRDKYHHDPAVQDAGVYPERYVLLERG
jgi:hypothetical protein